MSRWLRRLRREISMGVAGGLAYKVLESALTKFFEKSGEQAADKFTEYAKLKLFGLDKEDERRFNYNLSRMAANWAARLLGRLAGLSQADNDNYRLMIMDDDPDVILRNMQTHAEMDDPTWLAYLAVMQQRTTSLDALFTRFTDWARVNIPGFAGWIAATASNLNTAITDDVRASGLIDQALDVGEVIREDNRRLLDELFR